MSLLVAKFGGASVGDIESIKNAASKVAQEVRRGNKVVVVVAASEGKTDELINTCKSVSPRPNPREYDAIISTGEQLSAGLVTLALEQRGLNARSWMGWQIPILTDSDYNNAHILDVQPDKLLARVEEGEVAVVAGFQGLAKDGSITTLGRGGADTSAVALAAALKADRCDIYTNANGFYTANPAIVSKAGRLKSVSYEEMLEFASMGTKGIKPRSIEIALRYGLPLQLLSAFGNDVGSDMPGTLITDEEHTMENKPVTCIAHSRDIARITLFGITDQPGMASKVFNGLARAGLNVGIIIQPASCSSKTTAITFTVSKGDLARAIEVMEEEKEKIKFESLQANKNVSKVSLIGSGMKTRSGIAFTMFQALAEKDINIQVVETSEISITVLIAEEYLELALRILHTTFGLDQEEA